MGNRGLAAGLLLLVPTLSASSMADSGQGQRSGSAMATDGALRASTLIGGAAYDDLRAILRTEDGSYIVIGNTDPAMADSTALSIKTTASPLLNVIVAKLDASLGNVLWSTQIGGSGDEFGAGGCVADNGDIVVVGSTYSADFPATAGAYQTTAAGLPDAFCARLDPHTGAVLRCTLIGGQWGDNAATAAIDQAGHVVLAMGTWSPDLPTSAGAYQDSINGAPDHYYVIFDENLSAIVGATYLGGSDWDTASQLALASDGGIVFAGRSESQDFPVTPGAYATVSPGQGDRQAVVGKFSADLTQLAWCTFLGGVGTDYLNGMAVESSGVVCVGGVTYTRTFPVTAGAWDTTFNASYSADGFVSLLSEDGSALLASTYLGGFDYDVVDDVMFGADGEIHVCGWTYSGDFPVSADAVSQTLSGDSDAFVVRLDRDLAHMLSGTYLGGGGSETARDVCADAHGRPVVCGYTGSADFPVTPGAAQTTLNGSSDGYVSRLTAGLPLGVSVNDFSVRREGAELVASWRSRLAEDGLVFVVLRERDGAFVECGRVADDGRETFELTLGDPQVKGWLFWLEIRRGAVVVERSGPAALINVETPSPEAWLSPVGCPNPFNPQTTVTFYLPEAMQATLTVHDQRGRMVRILVDGVCPAGEQMVDWDGRDSRGQPAASGSYLVRLVTERGMRAGKTVLVR